MEMTVLYYLFRSLFLNAFENSKPRVELGLMPNRMALPLASYTHHGFREKREGGGVFGPWPTIQHTPISFSK